MTITVRDLRNWTPPTEFLPPPTERRAKTALREVFPYLSGHYAGLDGLPTSFEAGLASSLMSIWTQCGSSHPAAFVDLDAWQSAVVDADARLTADPAALRELLDRFPNLRPLATGQMTDFRAGLIAGFAASVDRLTEPTTGVAALTATGEPHDVDFEDLAQQAADDVVPARDEPDLDEAPTTKTAAAGTTSFRDLRAILDRLRQVPGTLGVSFDLDQHEDAFVVVWTAPTLDVVGLSALNAAVGHRPFVVSASSGLLRVSVRL